MSPPAALSPPSYSTKPASGEIRLDHTPRYPPPVRSRSMPSLPSNVSTSPWPSYSNYPPSTSAVTNNHALLPQSRPDEAPFARQSSTVSLSRSATQTCTPHSNQERVNHPTTTHRRWRSRRGERLGLDDVFFEGDEVDLGRRSTTFVLPSYQPGQDTDPLPQRTRRGKVRRALRKVKEVLCVDCCGFGNGGWEERGLVGAAAGATAVAVGIAAWALCG